MKKILQALFIILLISSAATVNAQQWVENLPQAEVENGETSFYEMQKAFNDYWGPKNVENGYYEENGKRIKAAGWKQFKRWEWFWESRVDTKTGAFPSTSALYEHQKYQDENPQFKFGSMSGNWTSMGPSNTNGGYAGLGRLNCIAFHPTNTSILYVGAAAGGLWKSSNGGSSWNPMSDNNAVLGISDIVVLGNGGTETIYLATGDKDAGDNFSVGVLKSTDGGITWNTTGLDWSQGSARLINRLIVDPSNDEILYAATNAGLFKSIDAGNSWQVKSAVNFIDLEFQPGNSSVIYASTKTGGDIYRSQDAGSSWTVVLNTAGKRVELAVSEASPDVVFSLICNSANGLEGVYKSTNAGSSFAQIHGSAPNMLAWNCDGSDEGGQGWYDLCIAVDPANANNIFIGGVNTWKSADGGANWTIINHWSSSCGGVARVVHADKHALTFHSETGTLYECNDGGLYSTADLGTSWSHHGNGLVISQMYRLGVSQTSSTEVIAGLQDNGTKLQYGSNWYDIIGGDGMECAIDPTDINIQYGELYYGQIRRTRNLWGNYVTITSGISGNAAWVTPFVLDPSDPNVIYVGYQDVWRRDFGNDTGFHKISNWNGASLLSLAVAPSNPDIICAATSDVMYRTIDGGSNWTVVTPPASSSIKYITIDNLNPDRMWIAYGQFNSEGVYETTDGGSNWTNISTGLPSLPVNCVIQNQQKTDIVELYAGTDVGVYIKVGTDNWMPFSTDLPNVVVSELEIYYSEDPAGSKLRAATFGRGLWESDLFGASATSPPVCNFIADDTSVRTGETIQFACASTNLPTNWSWSFPGGTPSTSNQSNPLVSYPSAGTYDVTLTVSNPVGNDTKSVAAFVSVSDEEIAFITKPIVLSEATPGVEFTATILNQVNFPDEPTIVFSKTSGPSWLEVANNGSLSGTPSLADLGMNYFAVKVEDDKGGSDQAIMEINVADVEFCVPEGMKSTYEWIEDVNFNGSLYSTGNNGGYIDINGVTVKVDAGTEVNFTLTPGYKNWSTYEYWNIWIDFNMDGEFNDIDEWVFNSGRKRRAVSGSFIAPNSSMTTRMRISMTDRDGATACSDGKYGEVEDYYLEVIKVGSTPTIANFSADKTVVEVGMPVQFSDLSDNNPTDWAWDFGNGQTSSVKNPQTTYNHSGVYDVSLRVTNSDGSDELTRTEYIVVTTEAAPPVAQFSASQTSILPGESVQFTDLSGNSPSSWVWDFGNGETSTDQNPVVMFKYAGVYDVILTVSSDYGTDVLRKDQYIVVVDNNPTGTEYCEPGSIFSYNDLIARVDISGNETSFGSNLAGYVHLSSPVFFMTAGQSHDIMLFPFTKRNKYYWRVWIDLNQDGDFDDKDELVFAVNNKRRSVSGTIVIPKRFSGDTRMRIAMKCKSEPLPCEDNFRGAVLDYDVSIAKGSIREEGIDTTISDVEMDINIFPNPVSDILNVKMDELPDEAYIRIANMVGQEVYWDRITSTNTEIEVRNYPKGIYFLIFENGTERIVKKFIRN